MNSKEVQTIYLSVDRREQLILVDTILYAQVTDKLCTIHFTQGRPIRVFMTLAALSGMLPEDEKTSLLLAFQQNLALRASSHAAISWRLDFSAEFRCFDRCPIPFFVLEKAADSPQDEPHYIYRYANEAMAAFKRTTLEALISSVFVPAQEYGGLKHMDVLADVALSGSMKQWYETSAATGERIHVISYQPHYGFCACFLFPAP